ncbi:enhanced downy mildew 2-like protein [Tanacetum coccineum]
MASSDYEGDTFPDAVSDYYFNNGDEEDHFDTVCAICDNGGLLVCCEGKCFRTFHATRESEEAQDSKCDSLCLSPEATRESEEAQESNCDSLSPEALKVC